MTLTLNHSSPSLSLLPFDSSHFDTYFIGLVIWYCTTLSPQDVFLAGHPCVQCRSIWSDSKITETHIYWDHNTMSIWDLRYNTKWSYIGLAHWQAGRKIAGRIRDNSKGLLSKWKRKPQQTRINSGLIKWPPPNQPIVFHLIHSIAHYCAPLPRF